MLAGFLAILGSGALIWFLYRAIKDQPEMFSKANLSKSFGTLGVLALILIGAISVAVFLLRH
jgi:hypothetical protein